MTDKPFIIMPHDEIVSGAKPDLDKTMLVFTLCERGWTHRKALATAVLSWRNLKIEPNTAITFLVSGYDDDPRELWQIHEVREFVQKFCARTDALNHPALEPMARTLLLACGADPTVHVIVNPISQEEAMKQSMDFFKAKIKEGGSENENDN